MTDCTITNSYVDKLVNNGTIYLNGYTLSASSKSGSGTTNEGTTGISSVKLSNDTTPADVYTIDGKLVKKSATNPTEGLSHGLYIINGKKVLVK